MVIARMLGMTVAELEDTMSAQEVAEWIALLTIEAEEQKRAMERQRRRQRR